MKVQRQALPELQPLANRLDGQRIAMLTLPEPSGDLAARPLTALELDTDGSFWFFVARAIYEPLVGQGVDVNLAFSDEAKSLYVSVVGHAGLVDEAEKRHALWTAAARPWFDDPDDPELVLLRVQPLRVELWDHPHARVVRLAAMAASVVAKRPIGLGEKDVVEPGGAPG